MQQPPPMMPNMASFPPASITTEQIQKYLDENKKLILAILDNQNLGKLAECAQYQAQLQKNLMYLAAIADAQPQMPAVPPQMAPHPAMQQQGAYYMQHPQAAAAMAQQPGAFPPKMPVQFATPQLLQEQQQLHQQAIQGHMNMRLGGPTNGMRPIHMDPTLPASASANSKQDAPSGPDAQGGNAGGFGGSNVE